MGRPKISIIVPVYNVEKYLPRCMDTLIHQTLNDIEIILVDDESPDNCPAMCDDYAKHDNRIKVIHKKNGGLGYARNSGLEQATGEYVSFVDSDDYVDIKMFEILYLRAKENDSDTVFCGFNKVSQNKTISICEVKVPTVFANQSEIESVLLDMIGCAPECPFDRKYQMSVWHGLYSKHIIENSHLSFPSEKEYISEDIIFHIDYLLRATKVIFIPDTLYYYCFNGISLTKTYRPDRFKKTIILYGEIISRFSHTEIKTRANRFLIGYTRSIILLLSYYDISIRNKIEIIKTICYHPIWEQILSQYEYRKLPGFQRLIIVCIKNKLVFVLFSLSYLKKLIKR